MLKVIMTKGLPASGKSTWAKSLIKNNPTHKRVNKDDLRAMIDANIWSKDNEKMIIRMRDNMIINFLEAGYNVIVDDTNFHPKHEEALINIAKNYNAQFIIKDFTDVPLNECIDRNSKRDNPVPEKVIHTMSREYIEPTKPVVTLKEKVDGLPSCIICDLDGTLAIHTDRSPYEGEKCASDIVNVQVLDLINSYPVDQIIFMSGRAKNEGVEEATVQWLKDKCGYNGVLLFMREGGDMRKDYVVKKELYEKYIEGKYNVEFCLDDRNQVVELWRELGLQCFQVADGNF